MALNDNSAHVNSPVESAPAASSALSAQLQQELGGQPAKPQTLLGSVIGTVRDWLPGQHDQAKEASSDDMIAGLVADTVSALPVMNATTSGFVRAGLLYNPNQSIGDNAGSAALNFAGGFALNKVGRMGMADSALSKALTVRLGTGLASEAAINATVGFGFGAVLTGFSENTWLNGQGQFDPLHGVTNVLESGAAGAIFSVPAGFLGNRLAGAGSSLFGTETPLARTLTGITAGVGSGYASGAVFGGLDAVVNHRSLGDILESANEGGIIGGITGGVMMGATSFRMSGAEVPRTTDVAASSGASTDSSLPAHVEAPYAGAKSTDARVDAVDSSNSGNTAVERELYDRVNFKPTPPVSLKSAFEQFSSIESSTMSRYSVNPEKVGPFENFDQFFKMASRDKIPTREYSIDGLKAKIVVPEDFAAQLDQVRPLRQTLESPEAEAFRKLPGPVRDQAIIWHRQGDTTELSNLLAPYSVSPSDPALDAYSRLLSMPAGKSVLPEELIQLLRELPDSNRIQQVTLDDKPSYMNQYYAFKYGKPGFEAAATAAPGTGSITLYETEHPLLDTSDPLKTVRRTFMHEDSHMDDPVDPLFAKAASLEADGFYSTSHARDEIVENRADHYADFISPDADKFFELANKAPLRTMALASRLSKIMSGAPADAASPYADAWRGRIEYAEDNVRQAARQAAYDHMFGSDLQKATDAVSLLYSIGIPEDNPALIQIARQRPNTELATNALRTVVDHTPKADDAWSMLLAEAQPGQPARNDAMTVLSDTRFRFGSKADSYSRLLQSMGNPDSTPELFDLTQTMPDFQGRVSAFDELMNLTSQSPEAQHSIVARVIKQSPDLTAHALNYLAQNNQPIGDLVDAGVIRNLGADHDMEAVRPLLALTSERPDLNRFASAALNTYDRNVVRYYRRALAATTPSFRNFSLGNLLSNANLGLTPAADSK